MPSNTSKGFTPRSRPWDALALLASLGRKDVALSNDALAPYLELIDYSMVTEFDSQNFDAFLSKLEGDGLSFTPEFTTFREVWRRDEWNHYVGYRRLVNILTGVPEAELHQRTLSRPSDFGEIATFLQDEFLICMTFAYDEIVTRHACSMAKDIYRAFGHETFLTWIYLVGRDEAWHFMNLVEVIRLRHQHRLGECAAVLERLLAWDRERRPYHSTFVLDHDLDLLGEATLRRCANILYRAVLR
ncbi:hypothetical protein JQX13_08435 [Archangium violaceum]|uniref:hypothetical protein n=1 Tax=Archangium violaceum TaxID=83451 RepID=UPI00193B5CBB|nr:hypothetical protein [Archangium violaceum]QRK10110.1 hypothetical protein JQX13_08435 [Archangium violaceum]